LLKKYEKLRMYLDLGLDILDGVAGLHLQGDRLPRQGLHEDLHFALPSLLLKKKVKEFYLRGGNQEGGGLYKNMMQIAGKTHRS